MSDAREFLRKWITHCRSPGGRMLVEAQREDLSEAEVTAAGGNLLGFMISELNRAAERGSHDKPE
jgi:hypothetical protein